MLVLVAGCAGESGTPDADRLDAFAPPRTLTFVIASTDWNIDTSGTTTRAHGLDLDHRVGGDPALRCTQATDFVSEDTEERGIDDQYGTLIAYADGAIGGTGVDGAFTDAILAGELLIVIELRDVNDLVEDDSVVARVGLARTASGLAPATELGALAADQSLVVDPAAVFAMDAPASIHRGRVSVPVTLLPLRLTIAGRMGRVVLHDARIEAAVQADRLTLGDIGGVVSVADLAADCPPSMFCADSIRAFEPDLWPSPTPAPPGMYCEGISAGFGFTAIPALVAM